MVKSNIFKGLGKSFVILAILIILSMLLFSSGNSCLVENLTPLGPVIDVMLWTDNNGSMGNSFVNTDWFELINTYKNFPNINFGQQKVSEMEKYFEPEKNYQFKDWNEAKSTPYIPCVTILIDNKGVKSLLGAGAVTGGFFSASNNTLNLPMVKKALANVFSKNYYTMYSNTKSNTGPAAAAAASAPAPASAASAASATSSAAPAASAVKNVNLSNFFK